MRTLVCAALGVSALISGCASMPPVVATYYLPRANTSLTVTQTLGCDKSNSKLVSTADVTETTTYSANTNHSATIRYASFGGSIVDSDLSLTATSDGRLSGVNLTNAGHAGDIAKGIVTFAATLAPVVMAFDGGRPRVDVSKACNEIESVASAKSKDQSDTLLSITYSIDFFFSDDGKHMIVNSSNNPQGYKPCPPPEPGKAPLTIDECPFSKIDLLADPDSAEVVKRLSAFATTFTLELGKLGPPRAFASWSGDEQVPPKAPGGYVPLTLNKVADADLMVSGPIYFLDNHQTSSKDTVWRGTISVPLSDTQDQYHLLMPTGSYIGTQTFGATFADDGSITQLHYATNAGLSQLTDAGAALAGVLPTTSSRAAAKQAQADLIYQQQRLVTCKLTPTSCPSS